MREKSSKSSKYVSCNNHVWKTFAFYLIFFIFNNIYTQTFGDNVTLDEEEFAEILKVMEDDQVCVCDTYLLHTHTLPVSLTHAHAHTRTPKT